MPEPALQSAIPSDLALHTRTLLRDQLRDQFRLEAPSFFDPRSLPGAGQKFGLLVNESAGRFQRMGRKAFEAQLKRADLIDEVELIYCQGSDLGRYARQLATAQSNAGDPTNNVCRSIGVFGGDGSARSVILALKGHQVPVLPLPGGTLNRLCHRVHGHSSLPKLLRNLHNAQPTWISGGLANQHPFFVACGFGAWMEFERVREVARSEGVFAALKALKTMRKGLFAGALKLGPTGTFGDVTIAAPGPVDAAFGLGSKVDGAVSAAAKLEIAHARLNGPMSVVSLAASVLGGSWRQRAGLECAQTDVSMITQARSTDRDITGLVDGELRAFGREVKLTYQARAALVLRV